MGKTMDISNFNHWFDVLRWGKTVDDLVEMSYKNIMQNAVIEKTTGKVVPPAELISTFRKTYDNNKILLAINNLHPIVRELGEKHQDMIKKVLNKINNIS